jgi:hypothetical protein
VGSARACVSTCRSRLDICCRHPRARAAEKKARSLGPAASSLRLLPCMKLWLSDLRRYCRLARDPAGCRAITAPPPRLRRRRRGWYLHPKHGLDAVLRLTAAARLDNWPRICIWQPPTYRQQVPEARGGPRRRVRRLVELHGGGGRGTDSCVQLEVYRVADMP